MYYRIIFYVFIFSLIYLVFGFLVYIFSLIYLELYFYSEVFMKILSMQEHSLKVRKSCQYFTFADLRSNL